MLAGLSRFFGLACTADEPVDRLASALAARLPTAPPEAAAWMRADMGELAEPFVAAIDLAARHGPVAGSAALYLEILSQGRQPGFAPGDIDCWLDTQDQEHELHKAALEAGGRRDFSGNGLHNFAGTNVSNLVLGGVRVQTLTHFARVTDWCQCGMTEACELCVGGQREGGYTVPIWPAGQPQRVFDIDVACVAVLADGPADRPRYRIERTIGNARDSTVTLLPAALWRVSHGQPVSADLEVMRRRLAKYRARGYDTVRIPMDFRVAGQVVETPAKVFAVAAEAGMSIC